MKNKLGIVMLILLVAGCAAQQLERKREMLVSQGHPTEYIDGHIDGCNSGKKAAGNPYFSFAKDVKRFQTDTLYNDGWQDGFTICKSEYESIPGPR